MSYHHGGRFNLAQNKAPVRFKISLIAEVKKHNIIWNNWNEKKNNDLLEAAWKRVRKALFVKEEGYCEKYWRLLVLQYRNHINLGRYMDGELVTAMKFMTRQLRKHRRNARKAANRQHVVDDEEEEADEDEADEDEADENATQEDAAPQQAPQSKKAKRDSVREVNDALAASVEVLKFLFKHVTPEHAIPVKKSLIDVLFKAMPDLCTTVSNHAKQHSAKYGSVTNIDWSGLDVPDKICNIVWDYKVSQMLVD